MNIVSKKGSFSVIMQNLFIIFVLTAIFSSCQKPEANFTWSPEYPKVGQTVQFTNTSLDARGYSWNLGDMNISSEENPAHVYEIAGNFIVDLQANNGIRSDEKTVTIEVKN